MSLTCAIIVNWNGKEDTLACLSSLIQAEVYAVVVDNASTDGSVEAIKTRFPQAILLESPENLGFGRANNLAIQFALKEMRCEYFFLLNNDAVVAPGVLDRLTEACQVEDRIGAATPKILHFHEPTKTWAAGGWIDWKQGSGVHYGAGQEDHPGVDQPRYIEFATGCAVLIKRKCLLEVGLFDPQYYMFGEDVDLSIRIRRAGYKIVYVPGAIIWHKMAVSVSRRGLPFVWYHMTRNRFLTMQKHATWREWLPFLLYFPLLWSYKAFTFMAQGERDVAGAMWRGFLDFLKGDFHRREP